MQKIFLAVSAVLLCLTVVVFPVFADSPLDEGGFDSGGLVQLNGVAVDNLIKTGESSLKAFKVKQEAQEQKQHIQKTQTAYHEAVSLYKQRRIDLAIAALGHVENLADGYRSTDLILGKINNQILEKSQQEMTRKELILDPQLVIDLANKAAVLEEEAVDLADDGRTAIVFKKLAKLKETMEALERQSSPDIGQLYLQERLEALSQKAEKFDEEIYKLTKANDLTAARKKYAEFERAMIDELTKLKQITVSEDR